MAFLRIEKKKSGTYMRIVHSFKDKGKTRHKTLHSLGKVEDYPVNQLETIGKKLLELAGTNIEDIAAKSFHETSRVNYGYALIVRALWDIFHLDDFVGTVKSRIKFDWSNVLRFMIAERINEPVSKLQNFTNQQEYLGFSEDIQLQHFYRTLDLIYSHQSDLKKHIFKQRSSLFSQELDVVFYDVTTLYFDSHKEDEQNIRKKGYSKDGKAHKTQVVLGLLVDKLRNPISYQVYEGNTYEGHTMIDALKVIRQEYKVKNVVAVADSGMIDTKNREFMKKNGFEYIIGDRIKSLPEKIKSQLLDKKKHKNITSDIEVFSYTTVEYKGRKIICTYSQKRAHKDAYERGKLIEKAKLWIENPSKLKQVKKRGAGRFIEVDEAGSPVKLDLEKINQDAVYDGFKAISTTTNLSIEEVLSKYKDLFEVEHAFRTLKSQLDIRPVFHWTNQRIEGHIAMCFLAYSFLNYLRNITAMQYREIIKTIDKMQMSVIIEDGSTEPIYMRSAIDDKTKKMIGKLKLVVPKDTTPHRFINQYFT